MFGFQLLSKVPKIYSFKLVILFQSLSHFPIILSFSSHFIISFHLLIVIASSLSPFIHSPCDFPPTHTHHFHPNLVILLTIDVSIIAAFLFVLVIPCATSYQHTLLFSPLCFSTQPFLDSFPSLQQLHFANVIANFPISLDVFCSHLPHILSPALRFIISAPHWLHTFHFVHLRLLLVQSITPSFIPLSSPLSSPLFMHFYLAYLFIR